MAIPHPASPSARAARIALGLVVCLAILGCDENRASSSPATPPTSGLVLLSGSRDATSLQTWDARGRASELPIPDPSAAWISAGRRGHLIATLADGTLRLSTRLPIAAGDKLTWHAVPSEDANLPEAPLYFATWAPNGLKTATLATNLRDPMALVIVDPIGDATLTIRVELGTVPSPPAWLDIDRVAIPTGDGLTIVDTTTAETTVGPAGVAMLTVAADGTRVAFGRADGSAVDVRLTADWLAGTGSPEASLQAGSARLGGLSLDRRGERLAVIWELGADRAAQLALYRRGGTAWQESARLDLPGGNTHGIVSWLP